jgi:hypothetical protein
LPLEAAGSGLSANAEIIERPQAWLEMMEA